MHMRRCAVFAKGLFEGVLDKILRSDCRNLLKWMLGNEGRLSGWT